MTAALVQSPVWFDPHATVGSVNRTYGSALTAGSCLVCTMAAPQGGKTWTVSDTLNGSWPSAVYTASGLTTQSIQVFAFPNSAGGSAATVTGTQTSGTNGMQICIFEISGINGTVDQNASNHGASANATSVGPTGALAASGEFSVCVAELNASGSAWAAGGSYNLVSSGSTANGISYLITPDATAQSPSFTWTTSQAWGTVVVVFNLGSPPVVSVLMGAASL